MSLSRPVTATQGAQEIVLTRIVDAPRDLVWATWTDADHLARWWGPQGFTLTTRRMEVRPGGQWRFTFHGPDGRDYENIITYLEVDGPKRLVYRHGGDKECEPIRFEVTVDFEEVEDGRSTRITMTSRFPSPNALAYVIREVNAVEGGKQTLTRLGEHLESLLRGPSHAGPTFVLSRVVRAERDVVFRAWTEREHLLRWFGPTGTTMPECSLDLRPGGHFHYALALPDGKRLWARWTFEEIVSPERLVFVVAFSDPAGGVARSPFDPRWPLAMHSTVSLVEHAGRGRGTLVTIIWRPIEASPEEVAAFAAAFDSMRQGWGGTLDRLAAEVEPAGQPA